MAEIIRPAWDEWDYGGDTTFLRRECYPMLKEMALFYAAYAKKDTDGYYHVIPSMEEERWGIYPEFSHNKDVISSSCMFRWGLTHAADAAELLGVDADYAHIGVKSPHKLLLIPLGKKTTDSSSVNSPASNPDGPAGPLK